MRQVASVGNLATEGRETSPLGASVPPKVSAPAKEPHHVWHAVRLQLDACHVGMLAVPPHALPNKPTLKPLVAGCIESSIQVACPIAAAAVPRAV